MGLSYNFNTKTKGYYTMKKPKYDVIPKDHDLIIIRTVNEMYEKHLPNKNLKWIIKILRTNYGLNGMIRVKLESYIELTKADIYKAVIADVRHNHTDYNSSLNHEYKRSFYNNAMIKAVYSNNDELIKEAQNSLEQKEKEIPRYKGKYFPNQIKRK